MVASIGIGCFKKCIDGTGCPKKEDINTREREQQL